MSPVISREHVILQLTRRDCGRPPEIVPGRRKAPARVKDPVARLLYEGIVGSDHNNAGAHAYHRAALTRWLRDHDLAIYAGLIPYAVADMVMAGVFSVEVAASGFVWLIPISNKTREQRKPTEGLMQQAIEIWNESKHRNQPRVMGSLSAEREQGIRLVLRALKNDLDLWRLAVEAYAKSPFHNGTQYENDKAWGIDTMLRAANRDRWIDAAKIAHEQQAAATEYVNPLASLIGQQMAATAMVGER